MRKQDVLVGAQFGADLDPETAAEGQRGFFLLAAGREPFACHYRATTDKVKRRSVTNWNGSIVVHLSATEHVVVHCVDEARAALAKHLPEDAARAEWDAYQRKMTKKRTDEWFDLVISRLERGVEDIKRRKAEFATALADESERRFTQPHNVVQWAINDVNNVSSNMRLDLAASHVGKLMAIEDQR